MRKSYLDGVRGWASLMVLFSHLGPMFLLATYSFPVFPIVSDGLLAVYIFFVLSGYVLSIGYFESGKLNILAALAVRRYPRLTVPIFASCCLAFILVQLGAMNNLQAGALAHSPWLSSFYAFPMSVESLLKYSLWSVYYDSEAASYNAVLWSMRYEFIGSVLVLVLLWLLRTQWARAAGYLAAILLAWFFESPLMAFALGCVLADVTRLIRRAEKERAAAVSYISMLALFIGLMAAVFRTGVLCTPPALAAIAALILAAVVMNGTLRDFFSTSVSQWLGHLSFPLYLTHLLVICSWSSWLLMALTEHNFSMSNAKVVVAVSTVLLSLAVARIFSPVENVAISLGRSVSEKLLPLR